MTAPPAPPPAPSCVTVVAHSDDDLFFCSPDVLHAVTSGHPYLLICVTCGDGGNGTGQMATRELASMAAYAAMAGVADAWITTDAGVSGHPMPKYTLAGAPQVSLIFMRLPDGGIPGTGFSASGNVSLQQLWTGGITSMTCLDSSSTYTLATLTSVITGLISAAAPTQVLTLDFAGYYGDSDNSDHHTVGFITRTACSGMTVAVNAYEGYDTNNLPQNVTGSDMAGKQNAVNAYEAIWPAGDPWITRQYITDQETYPPPGIYPVQNIGANVSSRILPVTLPEASQNGNTLIIAGRCYGTSGTIAPVSVSDGTNTWQVSTAAASDPPVINVPPAGHPCAFIAWCIGAAPVSSVTVTMSATGLYTEANLSEWHGITSAGVAGTVNNSAAAECVSPALAVNAGDLAVGICYPGSGIFILGNTRIPGTRMVVLPLAYPHTGNPDASNWAVYQVMPSAGTLAWDWNAATASAQAAATFHGA